MGPLASLRRTVWMESSSRSLYRVTIENPSLHHPPDARGGCGIVDKWFCFVDNSVIPNIPKDYVHCSNEIDRCFPQLSAFLEGMMKAAWGNALKTGPTGWLVAVDIK